MDIKLRARLSAYSKASSTTLLSTVTKEAIDSLFVPTDDSVDLVTKKDIDSLFPTRKVSSELDGSRSVTYEEIDSLFSSRRR